MLKMRDDTRHAAMMMVITRRARADAAITSAMMPQY